MSVTIFGTPMRDIISLVLMTDIGNIVGSRQLC